MTRVDAIAREAMSMGVEKREAEALAALWVAMRETILVCGGTLGELNAVRMQAFVDLGDRLADLVRAAKAN